MATMHVSLPDTMKVWGEAQTDNGRYSNASDYVRDLIRKDQERQAAIALLRTAIDEGLACGESEDLDPDAFKQRMHEQHAKR